MRVHVALSHLIPVTNWKVGDSPTFIVTFEKVNKKFGLTPPTLHSSRMGSCTPTLAE